MTLCFEHRLDGRDTDRCVKSIAPNLLDPERPVIPIPMQTREELLHMMKTADAAHILIDGGIFHFNALFTDVATCPAARVYYMRTPDLMAVARLGVFMKDHGVDLKPVRGEDFAALIQQAQYPERHRRWLDRWTSNQRPFKGLLDGRTKNTVVDQGIWLSSNGGCLVCGQPTDRMATSSFIGGNGVMLGLQLCADHEAEAKASPSLMHYVAQSAKVPPPAFAENVEELTAQEIVALSCVAIRDQLDCAIEKVDGTTITAVRPSGFRLILRQDSPMHYAYNIQDRDGKPLSRIDSADHHAVDYGPDHVHRDLSRKKKNEVESSFTYGFAVADLTAIRSLVEHAEAAATRHGP
ncbi:hypothetical protein CDN99_13340 [Roseateles aquatilis]|uniref:Uncharacterized protein n=2 Tax=Roseateles aquatilis TaxID=431061 RepID=A0A246JCH7_9BURK|nr:hypothetical protein CDN99_13340 [Roseateles aquatilis]